MSQAAFDPKNLPAPIIMPWHGKWPKIHPTAFIAPGAVVIGDVEIGPEAGIWFGVVIRGDVHEIKIGARTNVQDATVIHATQFRAGTYIGADVTIGHGAVLHACVLNDRCFVGMGATILDEAKVETDAMLAAGALLAPNKVVPTGELWAGNPARKLRDMRPAEIENIAGSATRYVGFANEYLELLKG